MHLKFTCQILATKMQEKEELFHRQMEEEMKKLELEDQKLAEKLMEEEKNFLEEQRRRESEDQALAQRIERSLEREEEKLEKKADRSSRNLARKLQREDMTLFKQELNEIIAQWRNPQVESIDCGDRFGLEILLPGAVSCTCDNTIPLNH